MDNKINKIQKDGVEYDIEDPGAARSADLASKQDALSQTQLNAVNSGIDSTKVAQIETNRQGVATNSGEITTINEKIPAQASASNQLADKGFVNSSIQTQTAHFRGNWENWNSVPTDASEYPADDDGNHEPTTNDYMVVQDASGFPVGSGEPALAGTWRFKYSGTWTTNGKNGWLPEYQVNETPLTSAQLAALNSGITDTAVAKLNGIEAGAEVNDIDSISVNGTPVIPDANKNVDLTIDGGIKTLTTEDYNYHKTGDTDDGFATWIAQPGIYIAGEDLLLYPSSQGKIVFKTGSIVIIASSNESALYRSVLYSYAGGDYIWSALTVSTNTGGAIHGGWTGTPILLAINVKDNLTSTDSNRPLSANQGRVLKGLIDALNTASIGTTETLTIADTDWSALSSSDPYDYSTTVSATATIGANSTVELLNDQAVLFSTYGFAIGAVDTTNNTVTIYSIGQPDASVSLKINVKG